MPTLTMSFEEYLAVDDDAAKAEWVDGEVRRMSPVSRKHQKITKFLLWLIDSFVTRRKIGEVYFENFAMRLPSGSSARVPDILFVHTAHANRITETFLDGPADLVVEVVSLDSRDRDRSTKFFEYEQAGVSEYWLIDPLRQVAEFYRINAAGRYEHRSVDGDGYYRSLELNGFRLNPVWLWQDPLPEIQDVMRDTSDQ